MLRLLEQKTNTFPGGQKALAKAIGCHENSIGNNIKSLIKRGWLEKRRNGKGYSLIFTLPEEDLQCRISYCTGLNFEPLNRLKMRRELKGIFEKQSSGLVELEQEVLLLRKKVQAKQSSKITLSKVHINDFVDGLLVTLSSSLDQRSFKDKVLSEVNALKKRLSSGDTESKEQSTKRANKDPELGFEAKDFQKGLEEILVLKGNKIRRV